MDQRRIVYCDKGRQSIVLNVSRQRDQHLQPWVASFSLVISRGGVASYQDGVLLLKKKKGERRKEKFKKKDKFIIKN